MTFSNPGDGSGVSASEPTLRDVADLVAVMDRLRSPGGCPWDAQQTHASLAPYAVEEAYELAEAATATPLDRAHLREELGDLLLQVVFHARVAEEDPYEPFGLDDVARGIADKLRRRHPHVFADGDARTPEQVVDRWEELKAAEKPERTGLFDGVPAGMPALERAAKYVSRLHRAGRLDLARAVDPTGAHDLAPGLPRDNDPERELGAALFSLVVQAHGAGIDPAAALRAHLSALEDRAAKEGQRAERPAQT